MHFSHDTSGFFLELSSILQPPSDLSPVVTANKRVLFANLPGCFTESARGKTLQVITDAIDLKNVSLDAGIIVKTLYLCIEAEVTLHQWLR
jgi:hypothetical protein